MPDPTKLKLWAVVVMLVLLALLAVAGLKFIVYPFLHRQYVMIECQSINYVEVENMRNRFNARSHFVVGDKGRGEVEFEFNIGDRSADSVLVIYSNHVRSIVYHGPFRRKIRVEFDEMLAGKSGHDILEFSLLLPGEKKVCGWMGDRGERYWRPDARIYVEFLAFPTIGDYELGEIIPWGYEVTIR